MNYSRIILACALPTLLAACGTNKFGADGTLSGAHTLKSLNEIAVSNDSVTVHFDRIDNLQVSSISTMIGCPSNAECDPPNTQTLYASISGPGSLVSARDGGPAARNLNLVVAFNPTIANGQACLAKAQNALIKALQFDIKGKVNLIPVATGADGGTSPGSPGSPASPIQGPPGVADGSPGSGTVSPNATSIGQLVYEAKEVSEQGVAQPIFIDLDVGVVLNEIESCTEGGPAVTPPPKPLPTPEPPPSLNRYKIHLSEITAVARAFASTQTNPEPAAAGLPYFLPLASISGKGNFDGTKLLASINIQLDDVPANATCLNLAQRLMTSGAAKNRGLDIEGSGWDLPVPMMACALNDCPVFMNVHLTSVTSCKESL